MSRPGLSLAGLALALGVLTGCGKRSCSETEADLEPLAAALEDRVRAEVATLYYATAEYRARVVQLEAFVASLGAEESYVDDHWRGIAPRLLVRAGSEPGVSLSVVAPGWSAGELEDLVGRRVLLVVYVPAEFVPPAAGQPAEVGRALYLCD